MTEIPRSAIEPTVSDPLSKRILDRVGAAVLLIGASPLLAALAVAVRRSSPGPVLFVQERVGRGGKTFLLYKFRTLPMEASATADHAWKVAAADARMEFLRRTGLDELPQLWNVLRGEMSLVGPRPERPFFVRRFSEELPGYAERHRILGGVTGWAQIHGLRGDTSIAERLEYDRFYLRNRSMALDLRILTRTAVELARAILRGTGPLRGRSSWRDRSTFWTT